MRGLRFHLLQQSARRRVRRIRGFSPQHGRPRLGRSVLLRLPHSRACGGDTARDFTRDAGDRRPLGYDRCGARTGRGELPGAAAAGGRGTRARQDLGTLPHLRALSGLSRCAAAHGVGARQSRAIVVGTDWPHPSIAAEVMPDDGHLLDLFRAWTPDAASRRCILVETPVDCSAIRPLR